MKENPEFVFTASSAQFYEWVASNDPAMLDEIRRRVEEGRWGFVGGWWVEPDLNLPGGESLVRQGLYGQRSFERLFGRRARTGFNPDGFGHPGTLPQILKLQGLESYVFMRPGPHEKTLPAGLFWWESPDGTRLLTCRIPEAYNDSGDVRDRLQHIVSSSDQPLTVRIAFYGVGDHGGGPTLLNLRSIEEIRREDAAPRLVYSSPDRYFAEVRAAGAAELPVVRDELQHHAVGCYTAQSEIKKLNRTTEQALVTAEKIAAVGSLAWDAVYPKRELTAAWQHVLFNQFHDSLAGTSLPAHYTLARAAYGGAQAEAESAMYLAVQKLAWQVPAADPDSAYLMVFNPHSWPAVLPVEYDLKVKSSLNYRLEDEAGVAIPYQLVPATTEVGQFNLQRLLARVSVPAFGYRQVRLRETPNAETSGVTAAPAGTLENEHLRVTFSPDGAMNLFDKDTGAAVVESARALVMDDPSDTWSHGVQSFAKQIGEFHGAQAKTVERGPVRQTVRVRRQYGASTLTIDWSLYSGSKCLEARVTLDWHEQLKMLKLSFPVAVDAPKATYETAYGDITRPTNGNEEPGQRWIDVTGTRGGKPYGLAIINDAKYGYSISGSDIRISIVRSAPYAHHEPLKLDLKRDHIWMDQGEQTFRLKLVPHGGSWQEAGLPRLAEELTAPVAVLQQGIHPGSRPQSSSFLSVDAANVIVAVVKQAEDNDDLILRCYETAGQAVQASINLSCAGKRWSGRFGAHEINTLRFERATGTFREVNLLEN
jgi:alpha-mannosidase